MPGPFSEYVPPGVYVESVFANDTVTLPGDIRLPILYGVAEETIPRKGIEMIRGSSAVVDFKANREDVSLRFVDTVTSLPGANTGGLLTVIKVRNFPIVDGSGAGKTTNDPVLVTLEVDDQPWPIDRVDGETGRIFVSSLIPEGANVRATYFYSKRDAKVTYTFPANYVNGTRTDFFLPDVPVTDGTGAGITTTDVTKIAVTVDNATVVADSLDGATGHFVLDPAPANGSLVEVEYYTNTFQDTADLLPDENIAEVKLVGLSPNRSDFSLNKDFVLEGDWVQWGPSYTQRIGISTTGSALWHDTQILASLSDNRMHMVQIGTGTGALDTFTLPLQPVDGSGRAKVTDDPSKVEIYVGATVAAAKAAGAVLVLDLNGTAREVVLASAPALGAKVFATFYYNLLAEDTFTLEVLSAGPSKEVNALTAGTYKITATQRGRLASVALTADSVADANYAITGLVFPSNTSDLQILPGMQLAEVVTVTFTSATAFTVTSNQANGSSGTGSLDQTFVAAKTGLRFTLLDPNTATFVTTPYSFAPGDTLTFTVTTDAVFKCSTVAGLPIPGLRVTVTDSIGTTAGDTSEIVTYKPIGNPEPGIGESYYVNYLIQRTDFSAKLFTKESDIIAAFGEESPTNQLVTAARLCMLNGAQGVILKQLPRVTGKTYASNRSFIDAIAATTTPLPGGIKPYIHVPLTTQPEVIQYLNKFTKTQEAPKIGYHCVGVFGYPVGALPTVAQELAPKIHAQRMRSVYAYKGGAVIGIVDALGREKEIIVDGSMLAAAYAGLTLNTRFDEAESFTLKTLVGFKRGLGQMDSVTMNQTATVGNIILEDLNPGFMVRQDLTTDMTNVLTRSPYVTSIDDMVHADAKAALRPFIGIRRTEESFPAYKGALQKALEVRIGQNKLTAVEVLEPVADPNDPTLVFIPARYIPIFSTEWIYVKFEVRSA